MGFLLSCEGSKVVVNSIECELSDPSIVSRGGPGKFACFPVLSLLAFRSPSQIARLVVAVIVDSIKSSLFGSRAQVFIYPSSKSLEA